MLRLCDTSLFYGIVQENEPRESAGAVSGPDLPSSRAPGHVYALYFLGIRYEDQEEAAMKCVICQYGETEPGTTTVTLTRGETTIVIREVPAQICTTCGEEYVDAATGKRLSQIAETALSEGVQVDVRRYKAA